jgi:hypothetical protein
LNILVIDAEEESGKQASEGKDAEEATKKRKRKRRATGDFAAAKSPACRGTFLTPNDAVLNGDAPIDSLCMREDDPKL